MATEAERAQLVAWKTYRVLLSRVDVNAVDIEWPEQPQSLRSKPRALGDKVERILKRRE